VRLHLTICPSDCLSRLSSCPILLNALVIWKHAHSHYSVISIFHLHCRSYERSNLTAKPQTTTSFLTLKKGFANDCSRFNKHMKIVHSDIQQSIKLHIRWLENDGSFCEPLWLWSSSRPRIVTHHLLAIIYSNWHYFIQQNISTKNTA